MDPKETLIYLLESIAVKDFDGAQEAFDDFEDWCLKGGYMPEAIHKALDALRFAD